MCNVGEQFELGIINYKANKEIKFSENAMPFWNVRTSDNINHLLEFTA